MLKEKLYYEDHLPINVLIAEIEEYPIHFHEDLEVVYLLSGEIILRNGYYAYTMRAGEVFIFNDREIHSFYKTDKPNVAMVVQIDPGYFSRTYPELKNSFFVTDMDDPETQEMEALKGILSHIAMESLSGDSGCAERMIEYTHNLLNLFMEEFQYFSMERGRFVNVSRNKTNQILAGRMNRIQDYLYDHYSKRLTLREIADKEHLSVYYLSHVIKAATGLSFTEFLNFIRVEESEKYLLGTDMKIADISEAVGFSALRYYVKYFTKWFGMHPGEYREKHPGQVSDREVSAVYRKLDEREIAEAIKRNFNDVYREYASDARPTSTVISVDLSKEPDQLSLSDCPLCRFFREPEQEQEQGAEPDPKQGATPEPKQGAAPEPAAGAEPAADRKRTPLLFNMLEELAETVVSAADNFIVTAGKGMGGANGPNAISVLIWNTQGYQKCDCAEYLVHIAGLSGRYDVRRIACTEENIAATAAEGEESNAEPSARTMLQRTADATPSVTHAPATAVNSLTFSVKIKGFGGELILIDRNE
jgi:AraC-like DNA-binding protein